MLFCFICLSMDLICPLSAWDIGRLIVELQQTEDWPRGVVEELFASLSRRGRVLGAGPVVHAPVLPGMQYCAKTPTTGWRNRPGAQLFILSCCKDAQEHEFYP
ncbi:hypothetical protein [Burkholderia multivorans]|uniref:hypothetical protein n=1 Tax=Burkholderia multivorans TaxID=87883 RepID=UPI00209DD1EE|nr:hypothetical protein [Burkholderia multivorans]